MAIGGISTFLWDIYLSRQVGKMQARLAQRRRDRQREVEDSVNSFSIPLEDLQQPGPSATARSRLPATEHKSRVEMDVAPVATQPPVQQDVTHILGHEVPVWLGFTIIAVFFGMYLSILVLSDAATDINSQLALPPY